MPESRSEGCSLREEQVLEALQNEFARVQAKAAATDSAFFGFLSIAVTPFLAFLAYALANSDYRIFVAALPFLSVIGLVVVLVLATHYRYSAEYSLYLQIRINDLLRGDEIRDHAYSVAAYHGWVSPVAVGYAVAFVTLAALNVVAAPLINVIRDDFLKMHPNLPTQSKWLLWHYWPMIGSFVAIVLILMACSVIQTRKRLQSLSRSAGCGAQGGAGGARAGRRVPWA